MIRWLVVGAGQAGRCHIAAIKQSSGADLAGVVDPASPEIDGTPIFSDLASALKEVEAEAVVVAVPNDVQVSCASEALNAGFPVLCEKPVGLNAEEADRLLALSIETGIPVGVVLNQRTHRHCRWIKSLIDSGKFTPSTVAIKGRPLRLSGWHANPDRSGGGVLRTIGIHYIDLLMWWLGPLHSITATLSGAPVEGTVSVTAEIGTRCRVEITIAATDASHSEPIQCHLSAGDSEILLTGHAIESVSGLEQPPPPEALSPDYMFGPGHVAVIGEATQALNKKEPFPVPLESVLPLLDSIQGLYRLARRT